MHWLLFICTSFKVYLSFIFCQPVVLWHNETWKRFTEIYCIWHWEQFRSIQFRALLSYTLNSWLLDCPGLHKNCAAWISSHTLMLLKQIKYSLSSLDAVKLDELLTLDEWLWWVGIGLPTTISEKLIEENIFICIHSIEMLTCPSLVLHQHTTQGRKTAFMTRTPWTKAASCYTETHAACINIIEHYMHDCSVDDYYYACLTAHSYFSHRQDGEGGPYPVHQQAPLRDRLPLQRRPHGRDSPQQHRHWRQVVCWQQECPLRDIQCQRQGRWGSWGKALEHGSNGKILLHISPTFVKL